MKRTLIAAILLGTALVSPANAAKPSASAFDKPVEVKSVIVPAKGETLKTTVTCNYYAHFMVKQVDEGEVGSAQLSIIPGDAKTKPACQRANVATEKVVDIKEWSGYV